MSGGDALTPVGRASPPLTLPGHKADAIHPSIVAVADDNYLDRSATTILSG
jgi:hypothetical protein